MRASVRRVVTGLGADGMSCVVSDGACRVTIGEASSPVILTELWKTSQSPAEDVAVAEAGHDGDGWRDPAAGPVEIAPGPTGTIFRICEFPPESAIEPGAWAEMLAAIGQPPGDDPAGAYHATATVDYTVILEGEIWVRLEKGETLLRAGDTLVQRGVNHAWENRADRPCRFVAVLVGARPRR